MSGQFLLDAGALSVSLFNTFLLVYLGLTVLLNAERRSWGVALAAGGSLAGALFFVSHSIILSQGALSLLRGFRFWWGAGWWPVIAAPYAWYLMMLWYSGFWETGPWENALRRRQRLPFALLLAWSAGLAALILIDPLPEVWTSYEAVEPAMSLAGAPLLVLVYPPFIVLCTALALDALLRPAPPARLLGDQARLRARPWLVTASLLLLFISLSVGAAFLWLVRLVQEGRSLSALLPGIPTPLSIIDVVLAAALMGVTLLVGQAVVAYEIFTGASLPRRGFARQWHAATILAAALSLISGAGLTAGWPPVILVLAILLLAALAYAGLSWSAYRQRQASMRAFRPLVTSERLLENIMDSPGSPGIAPDSGAPLAALCRDLLGARQAALFPLGTLSALGVEPLFYPGPPSRNGPETPVYPSLPEGLAGRFQSPQEPGLPLNPQDGQGWVWAAPLWSSGGLSGLLLLGEKVDGGLYSAEEIEIARSAGERLTDVMASAQLARRLAGLQRQRLAESGVLDRRARRVLHDEVLPRLHTSLLDLTALELAQDPAAQAALAELAAAHREISNLLRELPAAPPPELARLGLTGALRRWLETEAAGSFDSVVWEVEPEVDKEAANLAPFMMEVIYFAAREVVRNAARHGISRPDGRPLHLIITIRKQQGFYMAIEDNGPGLPTAAPSMAAVPSGGSGQGLALHSTLLAVIGGSLTLESTPGEFTRVVLRLPQSGGG